MLKIIQERKWSLLAPLLLCMVIPLCLSAQTYAIGDAQGIQNGQYIKEKASGITDLKALLEQLHQKYHWMFVYDDAAIKGVQLPISVLREPSNQLIILLTRLLNCQGLKLTPLGGQQYGITRENKTIVSHEKKTTPPDQIHVTGTVKDKLGNPLIGVTVKVKGKSQGTVTNANGMFALDVSPTDSLVLSYVGYQTQTEAVHNQTNMEITLGAESGSLNEVFVVAYGEQKKVSVTGAIASIQTKELKQSPSANLAASLAGRLPGLTVIENTGEPGRNMVDLYLRGVGTVNGQSPIILVDGVERDLDYIDPNEVASITILKDASSTALFGVRGANGVILVTTKRGFKGKPEINFTAEGAAQTFTRFPSIVNSWQYAMLRNQALENDGLPYQYSAAEIEKYRSQSDPLRYPNTDWQNLILKKYSLQHRYNLNISGGGDRAQYFVNAGYLQQGGQFKIEKGLPYDPSFKLDRYNFRSNIDIKLNNSLHAYLNIAGYLEKENSPLGVYTTLNPLNIQNQSPSLWILAYLYDNPATIPGPVVPPGYGEASGEVTTSSSNPWPSYGQVNKTGYITQSTTHTTATYGMEQKLDFLTKGLSAKAEVSFDTKATNDVFAGTFFPKYVEVIDHNLKGSDGKDSVYFRPYDNLTTKPLSISGYKFYTTLFNFQGYLNYNRTFNDKHSVTGMVLYQRQKKVIDEDLPYNLIGLSTRLSYGYNNKYFLEFDAGYNGSEQFAPGNRFGFFPAISGAWVISNEKFLEDSRVVNYLKVRGSYGKVGNDQIGDRRFLYLDDIQANGGGYSGSLDQGNRVDINLLGNKNIQWEVARKADIGLDLGIFNSLNLTVDVFHEKRDNILINRGTVPALNGLPNTVLPPVNMGKVENKGYEIQLEYKKPVSKDLSVLARLNVSYARDKILYIDEPLLPKDYAYRYRQTGYPIGQMFGYIVDGYFNSEKEIQNSPVQQVGGHESRPGDFKYADLNHDGVVDQKDLAPIGYPNIPFYTFGMSFSITYKNFDLSALFQGVTDVNHFYTERNVIFAINNYVSRDLGSWTEERVKNGDPILYPRLTTQASPDEINNTFFNVNASYIRLKNAEIGYTFPQRLSKKIGADKVRFYLNGMNILTWDKLPTKDIDPEISGTVADGFTYPIAKLYNLGVNISF